jgi:hypothetical protein
MFAATSDGKIYRDYGDRQFSLATAIASGLGALSPAAQFVVGGAEVATNPKKLFFFSGAPLLTKKTHTYEIK